MQKKNVWLIGLLIYLVYLTACAAGGPPAAPAAPEKGAAPGAVPGAPARAGWEVEWENSLAAAKKEGGLLIYSISGPSSRERLRSTFKDKYGLDLEFVTGSGSELLARARSERAAGLFLGDVLMGGPTTSLSFKDMGALDLIEPALLLPEVKDPAAWVGGSMFFFDKDRYTLGYIAMPNGTWLVNTDMLKPAEVGSYRDLLSPRWQKQMILSDPTVPGPASALVGTAMWGIMGEDYVRSLAKQEPAITRDGRLLVESVARGKYPIAIGPLAEARWEFKKGGAPIEQVDPAEGNITLSGAGSLGIFNRSPHPAATRIFVNWLLSREGQTLMQKEMGGASRRVDISREGIDPDNVLKPGVKYLPGDTEEAVRQRVERQAKFREIFGIR
ncbi:MAG: extracellular solute-binding protein [Chloroflexi bacterium]|nr:extracellular solute-binding protein [Chloroflexota bacterium]